MTVEIIEGPPPEFEIYDFGTIDVFGGSTGPMVTLKTRVRTFNSDKLLGKINHYWKLGESKLNFSVEFNPHSVNIVAAKQANQPEGDAVDLYVGRRLSL